MIDSVQSFVETYIVCACHRAREEAPRVKLQPLEVEAHRAMKTSTWMLLWRDAVAARFLDWWFHEQMTKLVSGCKDNSMSFQSAATVMTRLQGMAARSN